MKHARFHWVIFVPLLFQWVFLFALIWFFSLSHLGQVPGWYGISLVDFLIAGVAFWSVCSFLSRLFAYLGAFYTLDTQVLRIQQGFFFRKTTCYPLAYLRAVVVNQSMFGRWVGCGGLELHQAGERVVYLQGLPHPAQLSEALCQSLTQEKI